MPTYAYRCKNCSYEFEEWQKMSDEPLATCPSCKQKTLIRVIGGSGLIFKGSGFYLTDYKKVGSKPKEMGTAEKKSESAPREKTKGESKPPKKKE